MNWFFENICTSEWNEQQDGGKLISKATEERIKLFPKYKSLIKMYYGKWEYMLKGEISGSVEILKKLKKMKFNLIALTNWSAETFPVALKRFKFLKLFSGIVVSGEIQMLKPYPEIYNHTLKKYDLNPSECIFIDDRPVNILGAKKCGIDGIIFETPLQLVKSLKKFEIEI